MSMYITNLTTNINPKRRSQIMQLQTLSKAQKRLPEQLLVPHLAFLAIPALISAVYDGIKTLSHDDVSTFLVLFYGRNRANEHDEACQEISKKATEFIEHLWISEQAQKDTEYLQKALVTSYVNQFDDALSKCAPSSEDASERSK
eukprot:scaffold7871_cov130-Skeletonema_dohrnii-CCMP3373.AAC.1